MQASKERFVWGVTVIDTGSHVIGTGSHAIDTFLKSFSESDDFQKEARPI